MAGATEAPQSAALAGVAFALLMGSSLIIVQIAVPAEPGRPGLWLTVPARLNAVRVAADLAPFAGIAFLWFMGALRHRLGRLEDQFFGSVFLGSGLLFVACLYASAAISAALVEAIGSTGDLLNGDTYYLAKHLAGASLNGFAIKMAGVFMTSTSTIVLRTGILPRWVALTGFAGAAVLLAAITTWPWIALLFPLWILAMSVRMLAPRTIR